MLACIVAGGLLSAGSVVVSGAAECWCVRSPTLVVRAMSCSRTPRSNRPQFGRRGGRGRPRGVTDERVGGLTDPVGVCGVLVVADGAGLGDWGIAYNLAVKASRLALGIPAIGTSSSLGTDYRCADCSFHLRSQPRRHRSGSCGRRTPRGLRGAAHLVVSASATVAGVGHLARHPTTRRQPPSRTCNHPTLSGPCPVSGPRHRSSSRLALRLRESGGRRDGLRFEPDVGDGPLESARPLDVELHRALVAFDDVARWRIGAHI